jgi:hypothetical protein
VLDKVLGEHEPHAVVGARQGIAEIEFEVRLRRVVVDVEPALQANAPDPRWSFRSRRALAPGPALQGSVDAKYRPELFEHD